MGGIGEGMARFILMTFNTIFLFSGVAVLVVGVWIKVDKKIVNMQHLIRISANDNTLDNAAWILIGFGIFVLIISALGFFAACTQRKLFIVAYITCLAIIFIGEFSGGITAAVFKGKIKDKVHKILEESFKKYNSTEQSLLVKAWDYIQVWLECCGSNGPADYINVTMTNPKSGCYKSLEDNIKSHLALIIGVGVGIAMLQILGIVLAACICKKGKDE